MCRVITAYDVKVLLHAEKAVGIFYILVVANFIGRLHKQDIRCGYRYGKPGNIQCRGEFVASECIYKITYHCMIVYDKILFK